MVGVLDSGSSSPGLTPGQVHCIVFFPAFSVTALFSVKDLQASLRFLMMALMRILIKILKALGQESLGSKFLPGSSKILTKIFKEV